MTHIMCKDISIPLKEQNGAFIEVNSGPGLRMHIAPSKGKSRNVGKAIIDSIFPNDTNGRIPIVSITGVNGKTTTVNMTSHILSYNSIIGKTTTNGVYIGNRTIETGDCTGPLSAMKVLTNPNVDIAVLEYARGGIIKGLVYDMCDVGVITNIGMGDHMGEYFDNMNIDDIIEIKSVVIRNVRPNGMIVLNANDIHIDKILKYIDQFDMKNIIFFSINKNNRIMDRQIENGNNYIYYENNMIIAMNKNNRYMFDLNMIPVLSTKIDFLIENIMASIAVAFALNTPYDIIVKQLSSYKNDTNTNPGRFNILETSKNSKIILDYAHNMDSINSMCKYFNSVRTKKLVMYGPAGDREDIVIKNIINKLYNSFDIVILFIDNKLLRGRNKENFIEFIKQQMNNNRITKFADSEKEAIDISFQYVDSNITALLLLDDVSQSIKYIENKLL
jgi:cyanophycin synthetase